MSFRDIIRLQQRQAIAEALAKVQFEHYIQSMSIAQMAARPSDIATEASQGTVIDGVVVRKPQPRLT